MWVIAKIKSKYLSTLKNEFNILLNGNCSFYNPVFEKSYKIKSSTKIIFSKPKRFNLLTKHDPIKPAAPVTTIIIQKYIKISYFCEYE